MINVFEQDKMEQNVIAALLNGDKLHSHSLWHSCATTSITLENFKDIILARMVRENKIYRVRFDEDHILYYLLYTL